jgi:hypothetical protein
MCASFSTVVAGSIAGTLALLQNITNAWSSLINSCELMYVANVSTWLPIWRVLWLFYVRYLPSQLLKPIACEVTLLNGGCGMAVQMSACA